MVRRVHVFDPPDRFVADAVGRPGQRTFYLQARKAGSVVTVVLEKVQVAVLAERMAALLGELRRRGLELPEEPPGGDDRAPLDEPLAEAFRAGTLTLAWDGRAEELVVEARAMTDDEGEEGESEAVARRDVEGASEIDDADPNGPDLIRVRITPTVALAFVRRALGAVTAGRPPCPICGQPLDPQGHFCPRRNGSFAN